MDQIDIQGWAHSYGNEVGSDIIKTGCSAHIMALRIPRVDMPRQVKDEYWKWAEDKILDPIKEQNPDLYRDLVEWHRRWITQVVNMHLTEGGQSEE